MEVTFNVKRFDPESARPGPYQQEYRVELDGSSTVLDGLIKIREEVDGTLALRCSCRSAICGSCAMRVNGRAALACNTRVIDAVADGDSGVLVEPMGNMDVVKDLVVRFQYFWTQVEAVEPWLQPEGPPPESEYLAPNDAMLHLAGVMNCIMCGACVSECTVMDVDKNFLGPAALAKAYRFVADPRDDADRSRLGKLTEYAGIWDCTRCMQCVEVCPKGVDPMGRIMALRDRAIEAGYTKSYGARHATAFADMVEHSGWLDELKLPIKTFGLLNVRKLLSLLPIGLRTQLAGKRPPIFHKSLPGVHNIRRIFKKVESRR